MSRNSSKQAQAKGGFTLVELVVVIAVLAILAGVGAVAYNGYIEYAKKGVDRKTVGEIIHALELADYSDSSLIPEGGSATVYLTSSGTNAFDGEKTTEFKASVADALGDLSAVKLSYEKWSEEEGSFDPAAVSALLNGMEGKWDDSSSSINKYLNGKGSASFAGNIEECWGAVQEYIELFSSAYGEGAADPNKDYLLSTVVNESIDSTLASKYVDYFGRGTNVEGLDPASHSFRAAAVASNFAFAAWLSTNHSADITTDMMKDYESLTSVGKNVQNFRNTLSSDSDWAPLIEEYNKSQGETDMLAYLGMLEAAKTMEPAGSRLKDEEFVPLAGKVVNVAAGILNRSVDHQELETLVNTLADNGGSIIVVKATKTNGQLIFDVDPDSADPRNGATTCDKTHTETLTVTLSGNKIEPEGNIELCSVENHACTVKFIMITGNPPASNVLNMITVEATDGINIDQSSLKTNGQFTVTATKSGTITIKINTFLGTIRVNVHK